MLEQQKRLQGSRWFVSPKSRHIGRGLIPLLAGACLVATGMIARAQDKATVPASIVPDSANPNLAASPVSLQVNARNAVSLPSQVERYFDIPFKCLFKMSHDVAPGQTSVGRHGVKGLLVKTFRVGLDSKNKPNHYTLVGTRVARAPVDEIMLAGIRTRDAAALPSRYGVYNRVRELDMLATGYAAYGGPGHGTCATGMHAGYGVVAVDPRTIRLGSRLYIEGYGYAVAGDTGGAIHRNRIDLGNTTEHEARLVGRRRVHVIVLSHDE